MQNYEDDIMECLLKLIKWSEKKQQQILGEVLALEKKLNKTQNTQRIIHQKQFATEKKIQQETLDTAQYNKKIQQMILNAEEEIKNVTNPPKKPPIKKQQKLPLIPPKQRKQPVPQINRSKNPQTYFPKPNFKPKNQVTGKVTQTSVSRGQKVFRPNKSSNSLAKEPEKKESAVSQSFKKVLNSEKQVKSVQKQKPKQNSKKWYHFEQFSKKVQEILNEPKKSNKKSYKKIIQNLINEYNKEEMGNKKNEQKYLSSFLNEYAKLGQVKNNIPLETDKAIQRRGWQGCEQVFVLEKMLQRLKTLLEQNPVSEQYRMDGKQAYKIKYLQMKVNEMMQYISNTKQNLSPPPLLNIDFSMNEKLQNEQTQQIDYSELYDLFTSLLNQIKQMDELNKSALKKLKLLIQIGMYKGKRSPVIINTNKYEQWREYYLQQNQ